METRTILFICFVFCVGILLGSQARAVKNQATIAHAVENGIMYAYQDGDIGLETNDKNCQQSFAPTRDYRSIIHAKSIPIAFVRMQTLLTYPIHSVNRNEELIAVTAFNETFWYEDGPPKKEPLFGEKVPRIEFKIVDDGAGKMGLRACMVDFPPRSTAQISAVLLYHPMQAN